MKKLTLLLLAAICAGSVAIAIPAKRGIWKTLTLADGTEVRAELSGDEHAHFWVTADGMRLVADGQYYADGKTRFVAADNEQIAQKAMSRRAAMKHTAARRMARAHQSAADGARRVSMGEQTSYTGKKKGIVILAQFTNKSFKASNDLAKYQRILNEEGYTTNEGFRGSVADYFKAQSGGIFELEFDVVGPYTMDNGYEYYGKNLSNGDDSKPDEMIVEACQAADSEVNFADYDWDGDGYVDQVFVLYAGEGEADSGNTKTVWPHMYELSATNKAIQLDGVTIDTYACSNEVDPNNNIEGIGCFCHEFSHCMGFPDFYDITYSGAFGMGDFDLMCSGSYNGNAFCPAGYTAYEKMMSGWLTPIVLSADSVVVEALQPMSNGGDAYIWYNDGHTDEYYMVENRQKTGWDTSYPARGLLITHVDFDKTVWEDNIPNSIMTDKEAREYGCTKGNDHQRMTLFHADNNDDSQYWNSYRGYYTRTTVSTDLYPYNKNDSLTATSKPSASLYNKNSAGTKLMVGAITTIKQNADGTMSFIYRPRSTQQQQTPDPENPDPDDPDEPVVKPEGDVLFYESFDLCNGKGGNDGVFSGSGTANSAFNADHEEWEVNKAMGAKQCAKFGTGSISGEATTPSFTIDGQATLTFKAAVWGSDTNVLSLSAEGALELSEDEFEMGSGEWAEIIVDVEGDGTARITFAAPKRFFLDEVKVERSAVTGIKTVDRSQTVKTIRIYGIDGSYRGTDIEALPHGLYIVNGKKIIR